MFKIKFYLNWILNSLFALVSHCCFTGAFLSRQDPALSIQITSVPTSSPAAFLCTSVVIPSHLWLAGCLHIRISVAPVLKVSKGSLPCSDHFATFAYSTVWFFVSGLESLRIFCYGVCCFLNVIEVFLDREVKTFLKWWIKWQHLQFYFFFLIVWCFYQTARISPHTSSCDLIYVCLDIF